MLDKGNQDIKPLISVTKLLRNLSLKHKNILFTNSFFFCPTEWGIKFSID